MAWIVLYLGGMSSSGKYRCVQRALGVGLILAAAAIDAPDSRAETSAFSAGATSTTQRYWQVVTTANFRVFHNDAVMGRAVARKAETLRQAQRQQWTGEKTAKNWQTPCDVYLYDSQKRLILMTGGHSKAGSAVIRPSRLSPGRILRRKVNLAVDDPDLMRSTLPHEITHLILGDLLGGDVPRWANEGAATLAENASKQRYYLRVVRRFMRRNRVYGEADLMAMKAYPEGRYQHLFYAQSSAMVRYFLSRAPRIEFVKFLQRASKHGYPWALLRTYGLTDFDELSTGWKARIIRGS